MELGFVGALKCIEVEPVLAVIQDAFIQTALVFKQSLSFEAAMQVQNSTVAFRSQRLRE